MATEGQQHPLKIYILIWILLFLFSTFSYLTDFVPNDYFRWGLVLLFMFLKAGFIVAIFMHMAWERIALIYAILGPPVLLLFLIGFLAVEGHYTESTRMTSFSAPVLPFVTEHAETESD